MSNAGRGGGSFGGGSSSSGGFGGGFGNESSQSSGPTVDQIPRELFSVLYFKEDAESESIDEALEELGEDVYSEVDIRMIRIKFISELGN